MRGFNTIILVVILLILDIYVFMAVKTIVGNSSSRFRQIVYGVYWFVSVLVLLTIVLLPYLHWQDWPTATRSFVLTIIFAVVFAKMLVAIFMLLDDIRRGIQWLIRKFTAVRPATASELPDIPRSRFFTQVAMLLGGGMFATILYGISNRYNYRVHKIKLSYGNLPPAFKGLKILQISDIHSGSLNDKKAVTKGIAKINAQKADIVLFTGDLVNDRAIEMDQYMDLFSQIKAPMGVYSTLGNHDYGDYYAWPDKDAQGFSQLREQNLERVKAIHAELGWKLMMNEHVALQRGGQEIALIGIENWSAMSRFPKYGDLKKAYEGAAHLPFKILMSHDPTHWDAQVRPDYADIDLTLAGHTHGMQFGVEIPGFRWSPAQYVYKEWAGLYQEGNQRLYVNRGFGFLGYPGRVGILPEITVIELV
jgi:uncharacterized protein